MLTQSDVKAKVCTMLAAVGKLRPWIEMPGGTIDRLVRSLFCDPRTLALVMALEPWDAGAGVLFGMLLDRQAQDRP